MEEELVLHSFRSPRAVDPEAVIARCWATLGQLPSFHEVSSAFPTCGLSSLPLVRYGRFFFSHGHILSFFRLAFDLDFDLTPEERKESELLTELCVSRLHPATVYAMWMDARTPKYFFTPEQSLVGSLLSYPLNKVKFWWEKTQIRSYLERQHRVVSDFDAFRLAEDVHSKLSVRLGDQKFFNSAAGRSEYPRSLDIVVYAYLLEEVANLQAHAHIKDSFDHYPNLKAFMTRMETLIRSMNQSPEQAKFYDYFYVPLPSDAPELFFPPKIQVNPKLNDPGFFEPERLKLTDAPLPAKTDAGKNTAVRDGYVAGSGLILLIFLYFRA